jgi:hypothetical protein
VQTFEIEYKMLADNRGAHVILHGDDFTVQALLLFDKCGIGFAPLAGTAFVQSKEPMFSYATTVRDVMQNAADFMTELAQVQLDLGANPTEEEASRSVADFLAAHYKGKD